MNAPIPRIKAAHEINEGGGSPAREDTAREDTRAPASPPGGTAAPASLRFEARRHVSDLAGSATGRERARPRPAWQRAQERLWREFPGAPGYLVPLLVAVAVILAAVLAWAFLRALAPPQPAAPAAVADPRAGEPTAAAAVLDPAVEERAFAALAAYLEADGWEAKLEHVRRPYEVGDLMARHYRNPAHAGEDAARRLGARIHAKSAPDGSRDFLVLAARVAPEHRSRIFFVEQIDDDLFKIDWEASVGHQVVPLEEFQRTRPVEPVPFRVQVRRSDYYNFAFDDPSAFLALELSYPGSPDFHLYAYAPRGTRVTERLDDLLPEGVDHRVGMIVALAYPPGPDPRPEQVVLTDIVADSWFAR